MNVIITSSSFALARGCYLLKQMLVWLIIRRYAELNPTYKKGLLIELPYLKNETIFGAELLKTFC